MDDLSLYNSYEEIFENFPQFRNTVVETHVKRLQEIDKWFPVNDSFFMLINSSTRRYEYITKNFEHVMGIEREKLMKNGLLHWFRRFKMKEITIGMRMLKELVDFNMKELSEEERSRTSYCWNHRIRKGDGTWINVMNNLTPVVFDENGKPIVSLGFYTKIGEGEKQPLKLFVRQLNDREEYETLWQKNYSHQRLIGPLSNRERDIAMMMAQGQSSKEIGEKLFISPHTVDTHRRNILKKLSFESTTELIANFRDVLY